MDTHEAQYQIAYGFDLVTRGVRELTARLRDDEREIAELRDRVDELAQTLTEHIKDEAD